MARIGLIAITAVCLCTAAQADLVFYDGFDYTIGASIGDTDWNGGGNVTVESGSLSVPGTFLAEGTGGKTFFDVTDPTVTQTMNSFHRPFTDTPLESDKVYVSFILWHQQTGTHFKTGYHGVNLSYESDGTSSNRTLWAGKMSLNQDRATFEVVPNGGNAGSGRDRLFYDGYTGGEARLIVMEFNQNGTLDDPGDDTWTFIINPDTTRTLQANLEAAAEAGTTGTLPLDSAWWKFKNDQGETEVHPLPISFSGLRMDANNYGGGAGNEGIGDSSYDEVRVGTTFADVTPIMASLIGDFDRNGAVNGLDIPDFKEALADPALWTAANSYEANKLGDFDGNGVFNGLDIPGFKDALAGAAVPEPATMLLVLGGALCAIRRRK